MCKSTITQIAFASNPFRYSHKIDYFDVVRRWICNPLSDYQLGKLQGYCRGKLRHRNKSMAFHPEYPQSLTMRQPTRDAFEYLLTIGRHEGITNKVEVARDLVGVDRLFDALEWVNLHKFRLRPDRSYPIKQFECGDFTVGVDNSYDAPREAVSVLTTYIRQTSKITGDPSCLHIEYRLHGARACRSAGLESLEDLMRFDDNAFWNNKVKWLDFDNERLGRLVRNSQEGTKNRNAKIANWGCGDFNLDRKTGCLLRRAARDMQTLIDRLGMKLVGPIVMHRDMLTYKANDEAC